MSDGTSTGSSFRLFSWLYLAGLLGFSLFVYHFSLLDVTLLPRYGAASLLLLLASGYVLLATKNWPTFGWPLWFLLGYYLWGTASIGWATNFSEAVFESQKAGIGLGVFAMTIWLLHTDREFEWRLYQMLCLIAVLALVLGAWQWGHIDWESDKPLYHVRGFAGHKNLFSTALFLLAVFLAMGWCRFRSNWRWVCGLLCAACLLSVLLLKTRSTYLGLSTAVLVYVLLEIYHRLSIHPYFFSGNLERKKEALRQTVSFSFPRPSPKGKAFALTPVIKHWRKILVFLAVVLLGGAALIWKAGYGHSLSEKTGLERLWTSETGKERLILWEKTACVIRNHPWVGVGAGNWQIEFPDCTVQHLYAVEVNNTTFQRPHNDWLWVWAELGLPGIVLYLGFFGAVLYAGLRNWNNNQPNRRARALRLSGIAGFMVIACFTFPKERIELLILLYTLLGMTEQMPVESRRNAIWWRCCLGVLMVSCGLNLWIARKRAIGESAMKEALIHKQQKNWPALIEATDRAFSAWYTIDPTSIPVHWYRGTASFIWEDYEGALGDFAKAQQYAPFNQHVNNDLGSCYQMMGQPQRAKEHYLEAIRISPLFEDPRLNIGISYYQDGDYQQALDWINSLRNHEVKMKYRKIIEPKLKVDNED